VRWFASRLLLGGFTCVGDDKIGLLSLEFRVFTSRWSSVTSGRHSELLRVYIASIVSVLGGYVHVVGGRGKVAAPVY